MNRTISTNLGGLVFQVDEDAYGRLEAYLKSLERRFADESERKEILLDIESRIAELFQERMGQSRNVVNMADVQFAIDRLGMPEDIEEEASGTDAPQDNFIDKKKRLFRDGDNQIIGGICAGLAAYFGISDPIWVRLLFVLGFFLSFSVTFWVYIILWILVPKANTTAEKLQMRGEPVTVNNIERKFREEFQNIGNSVKNEANRNHGRFRDSVHGGSRLFIKILGAILIGIGAIGFISTVIWLGLGLFLGAHSLYDLLGFVTPNHLQQVLLTVGVFLVSAMPLLGLFLIGVKLIISRRFSLLIPILIPAILFLTGVVFCAVSGSSIGLQFVSDGEVKEERALVSPADTLYIKIDELDSEEAIIEESNGFSFINSFSPILFEDYIIYENVDLEIIPSVKSRNSVQIVKQAQGPDRKEANLSAKHIEYHFSEAGNELTFNDYLRFPASDKIRAQEVDVKLMLVPGTFVYMNQEAIEEVRYDLFISSDYERQWDSRTHLWLVTRSGLICADCGNDISDFLPETPAAIPDSTATVSQ